MSSLCNSDVPVNDSKVNGRSILLLVMSSRVGLTSTSLPLFILQINYSRYPLGLTSKKVQGLMSFNYPEAVVSRANLRRSEFEPSAAKTVPFSRSLKCLSTYSDAPERWATLAQAACKARYLGEGRGRLPSSGVVNVIKVGLPRKKDGHDEFSRYWFGIA